MRKMGETKLEEKVQRRKWKTEEIEERKREGERRSG